MFRNWLEIVRNPLKYLPVWLKSVKACPQRQSLSQKGGCEYRLSSIPVQTKFTLVKICGFHGMGQASSAGPQLYLKSRKTNGSPQTLQGMHFKRGTHLKLILPGRGHVQEGHFPAQPWALGPWWEKQTLSVGDLHLLRQILIRATLPTQKNSN